MNTEFNKWAKKYFQKNRCLRCGREVQGRIFLSDVRMAFEAGQKMKNKKQKD